MYTLGRLILSDCPKLTSVVTPFGDENMEWDVCEDSSV